MGIDIVQISESRGLFGIMTGGAKCLEFDGINPGLRSGINHAACKVEILIMIRSNLGDHKAWLLVP